MSEIAIQSLLQSLDVSLGEIGFGFVQGVKDLDVLAPQVLLQVSVVKFRALVSADGLGSPRSL